MKDLSEVFTRKEEILNLIDRFGFAREASLLCGTEPLGENKTTLLTLVVRHKSPEVGIPFEHSSWLRAKLTDLLGCTVKVTILENVDALYLSGVKKRSALITDEKNICTLFGVTSPKIVILDNTENVNRTLLEQAEEYLVKNSPVGVKKLSNAQAVSTHGFLPDSSSGSGEERELKKAKAGSSASSSPDKTDSPLKKTEGFKKN